jgi:hypothetical protein
VESKLTCWMICVVGIHQEKLRNNVNMPHPLEILGPLAGESSGWPEGYSPSGSRQEASSKYLRQTQAHADLLFHFTKVVVMYDTFKNQSTTDYISNYLSAGVESFLVVAYLNGYDKWFMDCIGRNQVPPPGTEDSEQLSSLSHGSAGQIAGQVNTFTPGQSNQSNQASAAVVTPIPTTRFTASALGGGKYKGWNNEGMKLHKKCAELILEQRQDVGLNHRFDMDLLDRFKVAAGNPARSTNQPEDLGFDEFETFFPSDQAESTAQMEGCNWEPV